MLTEFIGKKYIILRGLANILSGGEKQRISIARALIKDSKILLSDESMSNLDNKIASDIERLILNLKDRTVISITHKLSNNLKYDDEILVMNEGKIIERGSFYELMEKKGYFSLLFNL